MKKITPIILSGGVGARLWPISRKSFPKQFSTLIGERSLFQQSVCRVQGIIFDEPLVVTSDRYRFLVSEQLKALKIKAKIVLEPEAKNTGPAILAATLMCQKIAADTLIIVLPSDHHISDVEAFQELVSEGASVAADGYLVTFGLKPTRPETGFGYIEVSNSSPEKYRVVKKFHEKPNYELAKKMSVSGAHFWNSGIFLFRADVMHDLALKLQSEMMAAVSASIKNGKKSFEYFKLSATDWSRIQGTSIDYAIMENAQNIRCVEFQSDWSDLGDWSAVAKVGGVDSDNNSITKNAIGIDCKNTTLWSSGNNIKLAGLGLENIVAVATDDAVLVASGDKLQEIRKVVEILSSNGVSAATQHARDYRPWGWFESLVLFPNYQVKRLHVYPKASLSLQSHKHRSEHWIVVEGQAKILRDKEIFYLETNASTYISAGQKHRLSNDTDLPLTVVEVQTGSYLGEDDIVRYDDLYDRMD